MDAISNNWRPPSGTISLDRVAIAGQLGILDLFEGGNFYYQAYLSGRDHDTSMKIVDYVASMRKKMLMHSQGFLYIVIPNKASSLPENYPLWLPSPCTGVFSETRHFLGKIPGNLFADWMLHGDLSLRKKYWLETDSHWSAHGALEAATELLRILGVPAPEIRDEITNENWGGDLSGRWGGGTRFASETRVQVLGNDGKRTIASDNGNGLVHSANSGRLVHWNNPEAMVKMKIAIVGDSFSGAGFLPEHLTYWISCMFENTYFLHAASIPEDLGEVYKPDFVIFQTNERFLRFPHFEQNSVEALNQRFINKISEK